MKAEPHCLRHIFDAWKMRAVLLCAYLWVRQPTRQDNLKLFVVGDVALIVYLTGGAYSQSTRLTRVEGRIVGRWRETCNEDEMLAGHDIHE